MLNGIHAVSLDEKRAIFSPTLWNDRDEGPTTQVIFSGAHADVGGGYSIKNNESGLSDITFVWMKDQLKTLGVIFNNSTQYLITPDPLGVAHKEWIKGIWKVMPIKDRKFPKYLKLSSTIADRVGKFVKNDPSEKIELYQPANKP